MSSYWYCHDCKKELDGSCFTYQELCDFCGTRVLSIDDIIGQEEIDEVITAMIENRVAVLPFAVGDIVYLNSIKIKIRIDEIGVLKDGFNLIMYQYYDDGSSRSFYYGEKTKHQYAI